jgi:type IV pilus assembly protein PilQ
MRAPATIHQRWTAHSGRLGLALLLLLALLGPAGAAIASTLALQGLDFATLPGDNLQILLTLNGPASEPRVFHTENPARIALDLAGVDNELDRKSITVNANGAQTIQAVEAGGRTRVVVNLNRMVPYSTRVQGNSIFLTLQTGTGAEAVRPPASATPYRSSYDSPARPVSRSYGPRRIENVDFRRGEKGEGRLLITLSDPKSTVDIKEEGRQVILRFADTALPPQLARRLDVIDFATPVQYIEAAADGDGARLSVTPISEDYDYSSYQAGNLLTVEFRPLTRAEKEEIKKKNFSYSGEKLTLNFQDIPVRSVLQILADFTDLNIVASDTVQGNVTLRLEDVPWDQALDLVLKSKSLGKRQEGNIIRVAPLDEINKQEKDELEAQKIVEDLEPLRTEIIQINYTTAQAVKEVLVSTTERTTQNNAIQSMALGNPATATTTLDVSQSLLSGRGNVTIDPRTNQLIIKDTARNIERIRALVRQLDKPVRQVLIESRIVIATNDFTRELGSRLSLNRPGFVELRRGKRFDQVTPDPITGEPVVGPWQQTYSGDSAVSGDALVDLAATAAAASGGSFGITFLKVGEYLLDLELSAAQIEGRSEIISTPKVVTADQTEAVILQGEQIPYQTTVVAGGGAAGNITFKDAFLILRVTPHITPDDNVSMRLKINKDARGIQTPQGFAIDKREIQTTALVENGDTVVLGGIFEGNQNNNTDKVPFLGDLPGIGFLFRRDRVVDNKRELLIFITPKILAPSLSVR